MLNLVYQAEMLSRRAIPPWLVEYRWQDLWTMPLLSQSDSANVSTIEITIVRDSSASPSIDFLNQQSATELVRQRFSSGASAVLAVEKESRLPAGVVWLCTGKYLDLDTKLEFQLSANEAWMFGAWVRRDLRGRGLYREILQVVSQELRSKSVERIWLGTDRSNWRSRAAHKQLGATPAGTYFGGKIFGIDRYGCRCTLPVRPVSKPK